MRLPEQKKELAALLGITPEMLSRKLACFEENGLLEVNRNCIVIRRPELLGEYKGRYPALSKAKHPQQFRHINKRKDDGGRLTENGDDRKLKQKTSDHCSDSGKIPVQFPGHPVFGQHFR